MWQDSNLRCIISDLQSDAFDHSATHTYISRTYFCRSRKIRTLIKGFGDPYANHYTILLLYVQKQPFNEIMYTFSNFTVGHLTHFGASS